MASNHSNLSSMEQFCIITKPKDCDCKWSLPVTKEQWLQQGWKFSPETSQPSAIIGEGGGGVVYEQELWLCRPAYTKCAPVACAVKRIDNTMVSQTPARQARENEVMEAIEHCSVCLQSLISSSQCNAFEPNIVFRDGIKSHLKSCSRMKRDHLITSTFYHFSGAMFRTRSSILLCKSCLMVICSII